MMRKALKLLAVIASLVSSFAGGAEIPSEFMPSKASKVPGPLVSRNPLSEKDI